MKKKAECALKKIQEVGCNLCKKLSKYKEPYEENIKKPFIKYVRDPWNI
jgi:hypothetical protein